MFNAFINLEPVQRSRDGCDMRRLGVLINLITVRAVQDSSESVLEAIYLGLRKIVVESYSSQVWSGQ